MKKPEPANLTAEQLAARWCGEISVSRLAHWRSEGIGPEWFHVGGRTSAVLYPLAGVLAYEAAQKAKAAK